MEHFFEQEVERDIPHWELIQNNARVWNMIFLYFSPVHRQDGEVGKKTGDWLERRLCFVVVLDEFRLRSCCIQSCFKRELDEMNFRCVTSRVSKSDQRAIGYIRCNKIMKWLDALNRSISGYVLFKECHFLSSQRGPHDTHTESAQECWRLSPCPIGCTGANHEFADGANDRSACSLQLFPSPEAAPARVSTSAQKVKSSLWISPIRSPLSRIYRL